MAYVSINSHGVLYKFSNERVKEIKELIFDSASNELKIVFPDETFVFEANSAFVTNLVTIMDLPA